MANPPTLRRSDSVEGAYRRYLRQGGLDEKEIDGDIKGLAHTRTDNGLLSHYELGDKARTHRQRNNMHSTEELERTLDSLSVEARRLWLASPSTGIPAPTNMDIDTYIRLQANIADAVVPYRQQALQFLTERRLAGDDNQKRNWATNNLLSLDQRYGDIASRQLAAFQFSADRPVPAHGYGGSGQGVDLEANRMREDPRLIHAISTVHDLVSSKTLPFVALRANRYLLDPDRDNRDIDRRWDIVHKNRTEIEEDGYKTNTTALVDVIRSNADAVNGAIAAYTPKNAAKKTLDPLRAFDTANQVIRASFNLIKKQCNAHPEVFLVMSRSVTQGELVASIGFDDEQLKDMVETKVRLVADDLADQLRQAEIRFTANFIHTSVDGWRNAVTTGAPPDVEQKEKGNDGGVVVNNEPNGSKRNKRGR